MPAPSSTLIVTNNSSGNIWVYNQDIGPGDSHTFVQSDLTGVCADVNLRLGMLAGTIQINFNGNIFGANGVPVGNTLTDLFDQIVSGGLTAP